MGKKPGKNGDEWQEAKRRCRLSDEEVRMAKELGFKPRSLIKNIPAKSQPWKAPHLESLPPAAAELIQQHRLATDGASRLTCRVQCPVPQHELAHQGVPVA